MSTFTEIKPKNRQFILELSEYESEVLFELFSKHIVGKDSSSPRAVTQDIWRQMNKAGIKLKDFKKVFHSDRIEYLDY